MKKLSIIFLIMLCATSQISKAQTGGYSEEELPILVKKITQWSKDYPTVINNWNGLLVTNCTGDIPTILSIITEINGKSTKGMKESDFYKELMSRNSSNLTYQRKSRGDIKTETCQISYNRHLYWQNGLNQEWPEAFPENVKIKVDRGAEFFTYKTFALRPNENGEVNEKDILEIASRSLVGIGMKKDDANPDVLLSMSLEKMEDGSRTCHIIVTDAKKAELGNAQKLWDLDYNQLNGSLDKIEKAIKSNISDYCNNYPFAEPAFCEKITTLGVAFESHETMYTGKSVLVLPGCDAYNKGLRSGDQIAKGYLGWSSNGLVWSSRRIWFKAGKKEGKKNWGAVYLICIPYIPFYKKNEAESFLSVYYPSDGFSKSHFQIKRPNGTKFKVDAPMEEQTYRFQYMR